MPHYIYMYTLNKLGTVISFFPLGSTRHLTRHFLQSVCLHNTKMERAHREIAD